jgi:hypothetical protein
MNGTKHDAEAVGTEMCGRRALLRGEAVRTTNRGPVASDHAGTSNDKTGENPVRRKPKVSWGR